jgi:phospholipid/cholesterol/gamma-HCH transport system ATP-binding protein
MFTNMSVAEKNEQVNFCLKRVNMPNTNKKYPGELSGGMKKRVGIARAIVLNPKYLFCDEPNSGLDPKTALVIDDLIKEITEEYQMTTVINTHDMNSVMGIGDNVLFLHEGLKYWEGDKKEIMQITDGELFDFIFASDFLKDLRRNAKV